MPDSASAFDDFRLPWSHGALAGGALVLAGIALHAGGGTTPGGATLSMHASVTAAALIAIAAVVYVVHQAAGAAARRAFGRFAARAAFAGGIGLLAASMLRAIESAWLVPQATGVFRAAIEAPSWLAAVALLGYLRIEQNWRSRSAGPLIVPLVLGSLALDLWLIAAADAAPAALTDVIDAQLGGLWHLGGKVGVAASVVLGLWCLDRERRRHLEGRWLSRAMTLGFAGYTVALLAALALLLLPGPTPLSMQRSLAGGAVWLNFALPYAAWRTAPRHEELLVWWIALSLGFAVVGYAGLDLLERLA